MNWRELQNFFEYDPTGGDQNLEAFSPCGEAEVLYYLLVSRKSFTITLTLVRPGEVDESGVDRTVDLGTYKTWRAVDEALQADLVSLGCI